METRELYFWFERGGQHSPVVDLLGFRLASWIHRARVHRLSNSERHQAFASHTAGTSKSQRGKQSLSGCNDPRLPHAAAASRSKSPVE